MDLIKLFAEQIKKDVSEERTTPDESIKRLGTKSPFWTGSTMRKTMQDQRNKEADVHRRKVWAGGEGAKESEHILRTKFGATDEHIAKLKEEQLSEAASTTHISFHNSDEDMEGLGPHYKIRTGNKEHTINLSLEHPDGVPRYLVQRGGDAEGGNDFHSHKSITDALRSVKQYGHHGLDKAVRDYKKVHSKIKLCESEELDELAPETLGSYYHKRSAQVRNAASHRPLRPGITWSSRSMSSAELDDYNKRDKAAADYEKKKDKHVQGLNRSSRLLKKQGKIVYSNSNKGIEIRPIPEANLSEATEKSATEHFASGTYTDHPVFQKTFGKNFHSTMKILGDYHTHHEIKDGPTTHHVRMYKSETVSDKPWKAEVYSDGHGMRRSGDDTGRSSFEAFHNAHKQYKENFKVPSYFKE